MVRTATEDLEATDVASIADALSTIVRLVQLPRERQRVIERAGVAIETSAFPILRRIEVHAPLRLSDLAHLLGVDVSTASRQVKSLETAGLVKRDAHPTDGRASTLKITAPGRKVLDRLHTARRARMAELLADWSPEDRGDFAILLTKLADRLQSEGGRA